MLSLNQKIGIGIIIIFVICYFLTRHVKNMDNLNLTGDSGTYDSENIITADKLPFKLRMNEDAYTKGFETGYKDEIVKPIIDDCIGECKSAKDGAIKFKAGNINADGKYWVCPGITADFSNVAGDGTLNRDRTMWSFEDCHGNTDSKPCCQAIAGLKSLNTTPSHGVVGDFRSCDGKLWECPSTSLWNTDETWCDNESGFKPKYNACTKQLLQTNIDDLFSSGLMRPDWNENKVLTDNWGGWYWKCPPGFYYPPDATKITQKNRDDATSPPNMCKRLQPKFDYIEQNGNYFTCDAGYHLNTSISNLDSYNGCNKNTPTGKGAGTPGIDSWTNYDGKFWFCKGDAKITSGFRDSGNSCEYKKCFTPVNWGSVLSDGAACCYDRRSGKNKWNCASSSKQKELAKKGQTPKSAGYVPNSWMVKDSDQRKSCRNYCAPNAVGDSYCRDEPPGSTSTGRAPCIGRGLPCCYDNDSNKYSCKDNEWEIASGDKRKPCCGSNSCTKIDYAFKKNLSLIHI